MTAQTKLSAKGQVVIPKDVRDRLGLVEGTKFEVIERGGDVVLKRRGATSLREGKLAVEEAKRHIASFFKYEGPPLSIEDMDRAVEQALREKWDGARRR